MSDISDEEAKLSYIDGQVEAVDGTGFEIVDVNGSEERQRIDFLGSDSRIRAGALLHLRIRKTQDGSVSLSAIV